MSESIVQSNFMGTMGGTTSNPAVVACTTYLTDYQNRKSVINDINNITATFFKSIRDTIGKEVLMTVCHFQSNYFVSGENGVTRFIDHLKKSFTSDQTTQVVFSYLFNYHTILKTQIGVNMLTALGDEMLPQCRITEEDLSNLWNVAYPLDQGICTIDATVISAIYLFITTGRGLIVAYGATLLADEQMNDNVPVQEQLPLNVNQPLDYQEMIRLQMQGNQR